jgi:hypothetical protein
MDLDGVQFRDKLVIGSGRTAAKSINKLVIENIFE